MDNASPELREEIERNYEAFSRRLDEYMPLHGGKYALMRRGEVVAFYLRWEDAHVTGTRFYDDGLFSIQQVIRTLWISAVSRASLIPERLDSGGDLSSGRPPPMWRRCPNPSRRPEPRDTHAQNPA